MRRSFAFRAFAFWILVLGLVVTIASCNGNANRPIVVASKNFTEQVILGELLSQQIESKTSLKVDRKLNLGGTQICHNGLTSGAIDLYVEYTGTALTSVLKQPPSNDPQQVYQQVKQAYAKQFALDVLEPLGFNNTFAMIIRGDDAQKLGIRTLSQATQAASRWQVGVGPEFLDRPDGFPGLVKTYGLKFTAAPRVMDLGLLYKALTDKQVDLVAGNATDGLIASLNLVVLQDDKRYFPPYEAATIVRQQVLQQHPELRTALEALSGKISETDMRQLNYAVDGEKRDVKQVVQEFRQSKGL